MTDDFVQNIIARTVSSSQAGKSMSSSPIVRNAKIAEEASIPITTPEIAFGLILRLVRLVEAGMQSIDPGHGLSGSQLWALWLVSAQPGLRIGELAEAMFIHPSTASNLLDKLEAKDLIFRQRQCADSRVICLHLTAKGNALVSAIPGPLQGRLRDALLSLPRGELICLCKAIGNVLQKMSRG
ncbi:MarR family winged helix-turn-helix transcriptional regulator [Sulfuricystis multivorans]|uniref:MarR family winged helix-turn-helix transcriptional regulator n=1 Tax=Sulfuricystis multivorans TaxID=2211108 RepID=UPI000F821998|nr:MarR family transcriptional regulator [Sulfuricystis multivorans]